MDYSGRSQHDLHSVDLCFNILLSDKSTKKVNTLHYLIVTFYTYTFKHTLFNVHLSMLPCLTFASLSTCTKYDALVCEH